MPLSRIIEHPAIGIAWTAAILAALALHEYSHAVVGTLLGDRTARDAGRLTVNPLAHVDILGFLMLLLIGFGWGKPVPFDPAQLRYRRWGPALVAVAGPLANVAIVVVAGMFLTTGIVQRFLPANNLLMIFLVFTLQINLVLMLFNVIPLPPLDGSKLLLAALDRPRYDRIRFFLEQRGQFLLLGLVLVDSVTSGAILGRYFDVATQGIMRLF